MFPATLFDYNGVLVDDEHVHLAAFRDVLEPLGVSVSERDYWERYLGYDDAGAFAAILEDAGRPATDAEIRDLIERKRPQYLARAKGALKGFSGATELVRRRAAVGPVVIVSGALSDEIRLGLDVLGVADCVTAIVSAEKAQRSKPDPQGYVLGIAELEPLMGAAAARLALVVEDSIAGVQAAKAAGLACIAVAHSYPATDLRRAGADHVYADVSVITEDALSDLYRRLHG